jgi:hypothetical protein
MAALATPTRELLRDTEATSEMPNGVGEDHVDPRQLGEALKTLVRLSARASRMRGDQDSSR